MEPEAGNPHEVEGVLNPAARSSHSIVDFAKVPLFNRRKIA